MNRYLNCLSAALAALAVAFGASSASADMRISHRPLTVTIRPGVRATLSLPVFSERRRHGGHHGHHHGRGITVLAVPGLSHSAKSFEQLAQEIFDSPRFDGKVKRVIGLEFPGKGDSGLPRPAQSLTFGDLTLNDYSAILLNALDSLGNCNNGPSLVIGHSMGGLIIQLAQEKLLQHGSNLRQRFGVRGAMLIAPSLPGNIPWAIADSGTYAQLTTLFAAQTPELGNILAIPLPVWISLFFSDRLGVIYPFDPTILATYATNEAMAAALQLGGVGMPRLTVRERAFSPQKGTKLSVVSFEQDGIYLYPSEHTNLYRHLYGGDGNGLFLVTGANTVHDTQILAPELLENALGYHLD